MDTKIKRLRERLVNHRQKITEMEAQAAEMEREIKKAEEEQLGYLARSAANSLSGGMEEIFELLRSLRAKPGSETVISNTVKSEINEKKEDETVDDFDEIEQTDETEV